MEQGHNRRNSFGIAGRGRSLWSFGVSGSNDKIGGSEATNETPDIFADDSTDDDAEFIDREWASESEKALMDMSKTSGNDDAARVFSHSSPGKDAPANVGQNEDDTNGGPFV